MLEIVADQVIVTDGVKIVSVDVEDLSKFKEIRIDVQKGIKHTY